MSRGKNIQKFEYVSKPVYSVWFIGSYDSSKAELHMIYIKNVRYTMVHKKEQCFKKANNAKSTYLQYIVVKDVKPNTHGIINVNDCAWFA